MQGVVKTKKQAIEQLSQLPEKTLIRVAEISKNPKALGYFSNPMQFEMLKAFLR